MLAGTGRTVKGSTQRQVAQAMGLYMGQRGASCWPAVETLAEDTDRSERTVQYAQRALEETGWITVSPRAGGSNTYRATFPPAYLERLREATEAASQGGAPGAPLAENETAEGVHEAPAGGAPGAPELSKELNQELSAAPTAFQPTPADVLVARSGGMLEAAERFVERVGFHYADNRDAFAEELSRVGSFSPAVVDELRARAVGRLRLAEQRGEA